VQSWCPTFTAVAPTVVPWQWVQTVLPALSMTKSCGAWHFTHAVDAWKAVSVFAAE
jgi:hypothetical protein